MSKNIKLQQIQICEFRSIENIVVKFPANKPIILFGPNNVGKSNIFKALNLAWSENFISESSLTENDYFQRDKNNDIKIMLEFSDDISNKINSIFYLKTNFKYTDFNQKEQTEKIGYCSTGGKKLYLSNEDKEKCQFLMLDASRDSGKLLGQQAFSILSKLTKHFHKNLEVDEQKEITKKFEELKNLYEKNSKYNNFLKSINQSFSGGVDGFEHKLGLEFNFYEPSNLFKFLTPQVLDENQIIRTFEEFGTGEQQILLISFIKAYAETFKQNFILGIEEPEAHLHPIAQKWLAKNIREIAKSDNVQVIITTHSPDFLDIEDLEGFVKVYKEDNITKVKQHDAESLDAGCKKLKSDKGDENSILPYYKTATVPDQLRGFFARKLILVEGPTEYFALPIYFEKTGYSLAKNGVEIINCQGKNNIPAIYRLFKSYDYECFCLFDADTGKGKKKNDQFNSLFNITIIENLENKIFKYGDEYGYFAKDFESYMRINIAEYSEKENSIKSTSKQLKAKIIAQENGFNPEFIKNIAEKMNIKNN